MQISIVGGGRWARTIASVLCSLPSRSDSVVLHTTHDVAGVATWVESLRLGDRLRTAMVRPVFDTKQDFPHAVIVANRVCDHIAAALPALRAGIPTLVEKPIAWPQNKIAALTEVAKDNATILAGSNVFLFARYFEAFVELTATLGRLHRLSFTWVDGRAEIRRGEVKSYDPGVPLFDDVLPHIVPMLASLKFVELSLEAVAIRRGGAEMTIKAQSDVGPVTLNLARDGTSRKRIIEIEANAGRVTLDFASEPGSIRTTGIECNGDPLWDRAPRPLATMLTAFLAAIEGQALDARLSPALAMAAGRLADAVRGPYIAHQIQWLEKRLGEPLDAPLRYALKELAGDQADITDETIGAIWFTLDNTSRLKSFLSRSRLLSEAGHVSS